MKLALIILTIFAVVFTACSQSAPVEKPVISTFDDCVLAGNPVMESYPRQCSADGQTFVEDINNISDGDILPGSDDQIVLKPEFHVCSEQEKDAQACTMEYFPVCGLVDNGIRCIKAPCPSVDAKTYGNGCSACSSGAMNYYSGSCEEISFVVCSGEPAKGFDPVKFANDTGGICVDICPNNFDEYMTQIGVKLCIPRYDKEIISSWDVCTKSSDSCNCVKAYETTGSEPIDNPQYRCVPDDYSSRLIFRSGLDRLDEKGDQSVMIA
ncbi:hypothetical protein JXA48_01665 [Candidatus Woesearchaeota archaeon]|nr:hypothetical protein [Candidatus Woesearchaeota archaeon]